MTADDIAFFYIVFLAREAESPDVLAERAVQPAAGIVRTFLCCDEFAAWTTAVARRAAEPAALLRLPPSAAMLDWAGRMLHPPGPPPPRLTAAPTVLSMLCGMLAAEPFRSLLAGHLGWWRATRLVAQLRRVARETKALAPPGRGADAGDIRNLYRLIHGRAPESAIAAAARPRDTPFDLAVEMLASREFALSVVPSALDGHLGRGELLDAGMADWMQAVFGLALPPGADRQDAVVAILGHPEIRQSLLSRQPIWSIDRVIAGLRPADENGTDADAPPPLLDLLKASNLFDEAWYTAHHRDVLRQPLQPILHYVNFGISEHRDPGPGFDTAFYRERYPEVERSGLAPLEHYLRIGRESGNAAVGEPRYVRWLARFHDAAPADRPLIEAWADAGGRERVTCIHLARERTDVTAVADAIGDQWGVSPDTRVVGPHAMDPGSALDGVTDGTIVVLLGDAAVLRPHACLAFASALRARGGGFAYADHDHRGPDGHLCRPVFKPAMSPDFMRRLPYAGPVVALRLDRSNRDAIVRALRAAAAGAVDRALADLLLGADRVARVPLPLFSLPVAADHRTATWPEPLEPEAAAPERAEPPDMPRMPRVCILIPTRDRVDLLRACVDSILRDTDYPADRLDIVVIDNDSREPETLAYLDDIVGDARVSVVAAPGAFNFSRVCNVGAAATDAEILVFLNNDMTVREADWLRTLAGHALRPEIGLVGTQLLFPDETVQHGGIVLGIRGGGEHRLIGVPAEDAARRDVTREMSAMTGACLALRRALFEEIGGFDETLAVAFNDVALCLRAIERGYRNLYVARPLLYHHESQSRGPDDTGEKRMRNARETIRTHRLFPDAMRDDPFYSPSLSLETVGALAFPPRATPPWRRHPRRRRVLLLSAGDGPFHAAAIAVALQARRFRRRGWDVLVGGPARATERDHPGCRTVVCATAMEAACVAMEEAVDCVIAHDAPFFAIVRLLGPEPIVYIVDHGGMTPRPASNSAEDVDAELEWRTCLPLAHRVIATSETVRAASFDDRAVLLPDGNDDLAVWSSDWADRREAARRRLGFEGRFVVLGTGGEGGGRDAFLRLAAELPCAAPDTARRCLFVLMGGGDAEASERARAAGLTVVDPADAGEAADLHAASDLYAALSDRRGHEPGVGHALAMGLGVVASDTAAHRALDLPVADALPALCRLVTAAFEDWRHAPASRRPRVLPWEPSLDGVVDLAEADLPEDAGRHLDRTGGSG